MSPKVKAGIDFDDPLASKNTFLHNEGLAAESCFIICLL